MVPRSTIRDPLNTEQQKKPEHCGRSQETSPAAPPTATGEQVLQEHKMHRAGAARGAVALGYTDVGAATVVSGAWVGDCREKQQEQV